MALTFDGVGRYHNEIKVIVYSHLSDTPLDISADVITCNTNKAVKSLGSANLTLAATRNYFLSIFANDYINIYFNTGDGSGWTRNFFGFIDRVSESSRVGQDGTPSTTFNVVCSDFQKAFERTQIYFNPTILGRRDLEVSSVLGTANLGGVPLMSSGIRVSGTPSDMVTNVLYSLMGFASQFILPDSYSPRFSERYRQARQDFLLDNVAPKIREQIQTEGGFEAFYSRVDATRVEQDEANPPVDTVDAGSDPTTIARRQRTQQELALGRALGTSTTDGIAGQLLDTLQASAADAPDTLMDIIDATTFVEREAIDGFTWTSAQWQATGSIMQILTSVSNEIVNEMFFDLRPMTVNRELSNTEDYSREDDEVGGNQGGVQFLPCLVMREYPFATIAGIDARDAPILGQARLGVLHFGAIFSHEPNRSGRHVVTIPNINISDMYRGEPTGRALKHLDVTTLTSGQIIESDIGRSDADHFNLLEIDLLGNDATFFMGDFIPIITPIHVIRHGLRVRSLETTFTRFPDNSLHNLQSPAPEAAAEPAAEEAADAVEEVLATGNTALPVELATSGGLYTRGYVSPRNQWWYRPWPCDGIRPYNNVDGNPIPPAGTSYWRFHNGVDISAPRGTPVRAVRDGRVVLAAPVGTPGRDDYGNVVVIEHPEDNIFSLYAHLEGFAPNLITSPTGSGLRAYAAPSFRTGGQFTAVPVSAGDVIGYVGSSDCPGVHLHFEFNVTRNGRSFPSSTDRIRLAPDVLFAPLASLPDAPVSPEGVVPTNPSERETISQDPVRIFRERFGTTLPVGRHVADDDPTIEDEFNGVVSAPRFDAPSSPLPDQPVDETVPAPVPIEAARGSVDSASTRRQLGRWNLLHDHWYQHNLEYLSGNMMIRGNPMIRPGYRLDWTDRNLSFYVESASQQFQYPNKLTTTLEVSRGQPSNPYPVYVLPGTDGFNPGGHQRTIGSRLDKYFEVQDSHQALRAVALRNQTFLPMVDGSEENYVDSPDALSSYDENLIESDGSDLTTAMRETLLGRLSTQGAAGELSIDDNEKVTALIEALSPSAPIDEAGTVEDAVDGGLDA